MINHTELRQAYLPEPGNLNTLFVAEAAPDDPERFFYNDDVPTHDWLYLNLMKSLYKDARDLAVPQLRANKPEYLDRFRNNGYYLIDAIDDHLPVDTSTRARIDLIRQNAPKKAQEVAQLIGELGHEQTIIILIKSTVYQGLYHFFKDSNLPVAEQESIPFPSTGRQKQFKDGLNGLIEPH